MTVFFHTRVHRTQLHELVTAQLTGSRRPPQPRLVVCPTCGDAYFANRPAASSRSVRELEEWEALAKLDGECPDHPHWFLVGR